MENERPKSAFQDYPAEYFNHKETSKSNGLLIREIAKRSKKTSIQDTTPQAAKNSNRSAAFLGAVNRCYSGRKQSILKRFKECSLSPCSDEYKSVLQGFQEVDEEPVRSIVAEPKGSKNRKISLNGYGRGAKNSCKKLTSKFDNDRGVPSLSPRPRGNTLPSRLSEVTTPDIQLGGKAKATDKDLVDVPFRSNVKLAWHGLNDDVNVSAKKGRRRHVSLSESAQRLDFDRKGEETEGKLSETSSPRNISSRKETGQRKKAEIDLPKIEERVFNDSLQIKRSAAEFSNETQRKIYPADQMNVGHGFKDISIKELTRGENWVDRRRSYSSGYLSYNTEGKGTVRLKAKLSLSLSSPGTAQSKTSEISSAPLLDLRKNNAEFETLSEKSSTIRRTGEFAKTRASLRRVGKATLAATRLLKIHYRENGLKRAVTITDDGKELDALFEEMKDCRYLRQNSSEMRT